MITDPMLQK